MPRFSGSSLELGELAVPLLVVVLVQLEIRVCEVGVVLGFLVAGRGVIFRKIYEIVAFKVPGWGLGSMEDITLSLGIRASGHG